MDTARICLAGLLAVAALAACGGGGNNILDVNRASDGGHHGGGSEYDAGGWDAEGSDAGGADARQDGGAADAGESDAEQPDGGVADGGAPDTGEPDAGATDAGEIDGGLDAGAHDAGGADGGGADTGSTDAGAADSGHDAGPADAGAADAGQGDGGEPSITTVNPDFGTVEGGVTVVVSGSGFTGATQVTIGGVAAAAVVSGDTTLTFATPAHTAGAVDLSVTNGAAQTGTKNGAFTYVLRRPDANPVVVDGSDSDWGDPYLAGVETVPTNWGTKNRLEKLYIGFDAAAFYVAVRGIVESGSTNNAMVIYIDRDFGASTGVTDMTTLTDTTGALDNACSSVANASGAAGFGAEYCLGTFAMSAIAPGDAYPATDKAGMRDVVPDGSNFAWAVDGSGKSLIAVGVNPSAPFVETRVPWPSLGFAVPPAAGTRLAVFVRIVNADGTQMAGQSLPPDNDATPATVTNVAVVEVR